ncbi:MAG: dihydroneopterin aldolase [Lautropia sp.]
MPATGGRGRIRMQFIFVNGLRVESTIGVYPEERSGAQTLLVDVEAGIRDQRAFASDRLADTIDYAAVAAMIRREALDRSFLLLERLAQHLCDRIQRDFGASWVRIRITKPEIVPAAEGVGVVLEVGERR